MDEQESDWRKQLLVGLGVLVIVALLVGGIVGVIAIKAADVAGIGSTPSSDSGGITFPTFKPTKQTTQDQPTTPANPTGSTPPTQTNQGPKNSRIKLTATPSNASTYQRINLTGTYTGAAPGTSLQVQRREGASWAGFASVSASVNAGRFATWIETGQPGPNRFRMFDAGSGKSSNVVTVTIG
jgi:hypothetical protein